MRYALLVVSLAAAPGFTQDLPDPGRRLSDAEQHADPDKKKAEKHSPFDPSPTPKRDAQACEGARRNYTMACKAVGSFASHSQACAEAYAIYRQSCP